MNNKEKENFDNHHSGNTKHILPIDCRSGICVESTPREVRRILVGNHDAVQSKSNVDLTPRAVIKTVEAQIDKAEKPLFIYKGWCKRCGICIATCPFQALKWGEDGAPESIGEKCKKCLMCEYRCPEAAITVLQARKKGSDNA